MAEADATHNIRGDGLWADLDESFQVAPYRYLNAGSERTYVGSDGYGAVV